MSQITLPMIVERTRTQLNTLISRHNDLATELGELRGKTDAESTARIAELRSQKAVVDAEMTALRSKYDALQAEQAEDEEVARLQNISTPTSVGAVGTEHLRMGDGGQPPRASTPTWVRADTLEPAAVGLSERVADHPAVRRISAGRAAADAAVVGQHGDLGQFVRALTTTGGSAIVPTVWSAELIDLARNKAAVLQAGAPIIPMDAKTVEIGRLTGDPLAAFRAEGSPIPPSDPTFDNVTLEAKTLSAQVIGSMEWFQDADNANAVVTEALAAALANRIDLVALYGGITAGHGDLDLPTPPNPRGILAALNAVATSSVLGGVADGTTQTAGAYYDELIDLLFTVRDHNEEPNALIWNSKAGRQYAKAYDTTGQPLAVPAAVAAIRQLTTNQVPSYTQGTMVDRATDVFAGDFTQLLVGQRLDITVQVLNERYADTGEIGIVAHWRGDVQPARPRAFAAFTGLRGAA